MNPYGGIQGQGAALVGSSNPVPQAPALQSLNNRYRDAVTSLLNGCNRLEQLLDRLAPAPKNATAPGAEKPVPGGAIHALESTALDLENACKWLHDISERLERIA